MTCWFGTGDDQLESRVVEQIDAPRIIDVAFTNLDFDTIDVTFDEVQQGRASNIGSVIIKGGISGSRNTGEFYAIAAAGKISSVVAHGISSGPAIDDNNIVRKTYDNKAVQSSSFVLDELFADPADEPFQVIYAGLDMRFGTGDDVAYYFGHDDDANLSVTFDE